MSYPDLAPLFNSIYVYVDFHSFKVFTFLSHITSYIAAIHASLYFSFII